MFSESGENIACRLTSTGGSKSCIGVDGRVVAYGASRDGRWSLVVGDRSTPIDRAPSFVFLSSDGRSVGYCRLEPDGDGGSRVRVVVDGTAGEPYDLVGLPVFSPDGTKVTYAADEGEKQYVVVGTARIEVRGRVGDPVFSPDGRQVGYGARLGREIWWKVLDAP